MPSIDFSNVQGLEPIPAGTYEAEVVEAKEGVSRTENPKIDLRWKILGGSQDGRVVFDTLAFSPNALWRVKNTLLGLGFSKDFTGDVTPEDLIGRSATIMVTIETSDQIDPETGEPYPPRNRISKVKALAGAKAKAAKKGLFS